MENKATTAPVMEETTKLAVVFDKATPRKPQVAANKLSDTLLKGVHLNVAFADVAQIKAVDSDFVLTLKSGGKLRVKNGAADAAAEPEFSLEFLDTCLSGQDAIAYSEKDGDAALASVPMSEAGISEPVDIASSPVAETCHAHSLPDALLPTVTEEATEPLYSLGLFGAIVGGAVALAGIALENQTSTVAGDSSYTPIDAFSAKTTIKGIVTAGPVIALLHAQVFSAAGKLLAETTSDSSGNFTFDLGPSYSGLVLVRVTDTNGTASDYVDEFTEKGVNLAGALRGFLKVTAGQINSVNLTVLTELAVQKALLDAGLPIDSTTPPTQEQAAKAYSNVGALFGVSDISAAAIPIVSSSGAKNGDYNAADGLTAAEKYGQVLAKLSGNDYNTGSMDATLKLYLGVLTNTSSTSQSVTADVNKLLEQGVTAFQNANVSTAVYAGFPAPDTTSTRVLLAPSILSANFAQAKMAAEPLLNDGFISTSDLGQTIIFALPIASGAVVGDVLKLSIPGSTGHATFTISHTLSAADLLQAYVSLVVAKLDLLSTGDGEKMMTVNVTGSGATAVDYPAFAAHGGIFTLDTVAPQPTIQLASGVSNGATLDEATASKGVLTVKAEFGAVTVVTFSNGSHTVPKPFSGTGSPQIVTLNSSDLALLGEGTITVTAVSTDAAGNTAAATPVNFTLDTAPPTAPALALTHAAAGGATQAEATTDGVVTVTAESGSTTVVTFSDGTHTFTQNVQGAGPNAVVVVLNRTDLDTLTNGTISVRAVTTDAAGNTGSAATTSFTLDTVAPTQTVSGTAFSNGSGIGLADLVTNIDLQTITSRLSAALATSDKLYGSTDGGSHWTDITSQVNGTNITWTDAKLVPGGSLQFKVSDAAGNTDSITTVAYTLDTAPPTAPALVLTGAAADGVNRAEASAGLDVISLITELGASAVVTFTNGSKEVIKLTTGTGSPQAIALSTYDLTLLGNGTIGVNAVTTDAAGNSSDTKHSSSFMLDTLAPKVPELRLTNAAENGVDLTEFSAGLDVLRVITELGASTVVTFTNGSQKVIKPVSGTGGSMVIALTNAELTKLGDGTISVNAVTTDEAGNTATTRYDSTFLLDTLPPTMPALTLISAAADGYVNSAEVSTLNEIISLTSDAYGITVVTFTNASQSISKLVAGTGSPQAIALGIDELNQLGNGTITVSAITFDTAGNVVSATGNTSFKLDTLSPDMPALTLISVAADGFVSSAEVITGGAIISLTADADGITVVTFSNSGAGKTWSKEVTGQGNTPVTVTLTSGELAALLDGTITVNAVTTDAAGNATSTANNISFTLRTGPPTQTVSGTAFSADTGTYNNDLVTNETYQTIITATLNGGLLGSDTLWGSTTGGDSWENITRYVSGTSIQWKNVGLIPGYSLQFKVTDGLGNTSPLTTVDYVLDTRAPLMSLEGPIYDYKANGVYYISNVENLAEYTVIAEKGANFTLTLTGGNNYARTVNLVATGEKQAIYHTSSELYALSNNALSVTTSVVDLAGNGSYFPIWQVALIDTYKGAIFATIDSATNMHNGILHAGSVVTATVTLLENVTVSGAATLKLMIGAEAVWANYVSGTGTQTLTFQYTILDGQNDDNGIAIIANSLGGSITGQSSSLSLANVGTKNLSRYKVDTGAPLAPDLHLGSGVDDGATLAEATASTGVLTFTAGGGTSTQVTFANGTTTVIKTVPGSDIKTVVVTLTTDDLTKLGNGTITVSAVTTDSVGNTGAAATTSFTLDTVAPTQTVSGTAFSTGSGTGLADLVTNSDVQTITGTLSAVLDAKDKLYGSTNGGTTWIDITGQVSGTAINWTDATLVAGGSLQFKVSDAAGNMDSITTVAYTLDTAPPTAPSLALSGAAADGFVNSAEALTSPQVLTVTAESGSTTVVTFSNGTHTFTSTVTSTDSTAVPVTLSRADLRELTDGTITVSAVTTDAAGNKGTEASTSFTLAMVAPTQTVSAVAFSADPDHNLITKTPTQTITATLSGTLASGDILYGSTDGGVHWTDITSKVSSDTAISWNNALLTSSGSLQFKVTNGSGATGPVSTVGYVLDQLLPSCTVVSAGNNMTLDMLENTGAYTVTTEKGATVNISIAYGYESPAIGFNENGRIIRTLIGTGAAQAITFTSSEISNLQLSGSYEIRSVQSYVSATDLAGNVKTANDATSYTIGFLDYGYHIATIDSATNMQNGVLHAGSVVTATVHFNDSTVLVNGVPTLDLSIGGTPVQAKYAGGNNTKTLTFTYTIEDGQTDTNGISVVADSLSGDVTLASSHAAVSTNTGTTDLSAYKVNTTDVVPTLSSFQVTDPSTHSATVNSTKAGTAYLVHDSIVVSAVSDITGAASHDWASVSVAANTDTTLSFANLNSGSYHLYTDDGAGHLSAQSSTAGYVAASTISLGSGNGNLIAPVVVAGKLYYIWDKSGDGSIGADDVLQHTTLDSLFNHDINGALSSSLLTDETHRYATLNQVKVALPTVGVTGVLTGTNPGTAYTDNGAGNNNTSSTKYVDLAAIWDAYNGVASGPTATNIAGKPPAWASDSYWSATYNATGHTAFALNDGSTEIDLSSNVSHYIALQVL